MIATGAYDRQLPFPGWTLPGVFTAGGAQALLKGQGVRAGRRIAVAGTGPFLLAVAAGLAEAGSDVVGVFEAGLPTAFVRHPLAVARNPGKLAEGAGFLRTLLRHRVPYRTRTTVVAAHAAHAAHGAHGEGEVSGVTVAALDARWRTVPGSERRLDCDTLAVGYGFTPQIEIPLQLGCDTRRDIDGSLVATADGRQLSTVPGVYLAGEVCGVGGAELSVTEGRLAGLHAAYATVGATPDPAAVRRLSHRRAALRSFATTLHEAYPVRPGWTGWIDDDTVVCRCEEVTAGAITEVIEELGATDSRAVKLFARPGMGLCQGRVCGYATSCLVAARTGRAPTEDDLRSTASRPIAQPVPLGALAAAAKPAAQPQQSRPNQQSLRGGRMNASAPGQPQPQPQRQQQPHHKPWHGVLVATALPLRDGSTGRLEVDFDGYSDHVSWLAENGCDGVTPNGSLGEYQTLSPEERARVVTTAVETAPEGFTVMPGVAAYGADEARRWAEQAAEAGAAAVMLLPPNSYRADPRAVVAHYREVARAGLPVVAYNNPFDTKVDLVPELLAELHAEGLIVAVKEFSGDVRRSYRIAELAPVSMCCAAPTMSRWSWPSRALPAGSPVIPTRSPVPRSRCGAPPRPVIWRPRCRFTGRCTRCCAGTPGRSSCRRSRRAWIWRAATAVHAASRAFRSPPSTRRSCAGPPRRRSRKGSGKPYAQQQGLPRGRFPHRGHAHPGHHRRRRCGARRHHVRPAPLLHRTPRPHP